MIEQGQICQLYEVAGEDPEFRPSPYCWRTRMALAHKRLPFDPIPWHAVEKSRISRSGGGTVPVLVDQDRWIRDSWQIALYLEQSYEEHPLFDGAADIAKTRFLNAWADSVLHPVIFRAVIAEQYPLLAEVDKPAYLVRTLQKFGHTVEELGSNPEIAVSEVTQALRPISEALTIKPFLGGATPGYGDYVVFGTFQWARVVSLCKF